MELLKTHAQKNCSDLQFLAEFSSRNLFIGCCFEDLSRNQSVVNLKAAGHSAVNRGFAFIGWKNIFSIPIFRFFPLFTYF